MPCLRQNPVNAGYDNAAPPATSSSWTRTRFPLHDVKSSRICSRYGSAFSARWISGTLVELDRSTLRTVSRDSRSTCAISCLLTPFALSSRIAVRCAWLSMFRLPLLSDSFRHPVEFPAHSFQLALRLFLLRTSHLRQRFGKPPSGTTQDGDHHIQIALYLLERRRLGWWRLPLRFQKQFWLGENAFADRARALAPGRAQLPGLPRIATMRHESGRHACAVVGADSRHRHQMLHRHLRREFSFAHLLLDRFRQQLHQRQPPRHPTGAAVEAARQFIQTIAEALLHLRQQPALFERAFLRAEPQRPRQQQSFGFAHRPDRGFDCVP